MAYHILDYGAIPGEGNLNTKPIQNAIDDCEAHGGGTVVIPNGLFITGTIYLKSNVELHLEMGAELKASTNPEDYNALDAYPENHSCKSEGWDGRHFIIAHHVENVAITGLGTINGSADTYFDGEPYDPGFHSIWSYGLQFQKGFIFGMKEAENPRPGQLVVFVDCKNIRIIDVTVINSPCWCMFLHGCENVQVRGYKAFNKRTWANTDGLDIDTCKNVTVSDCIIDTGDDGITLRCDSKKLKNGKIACENITITNSVLACSSSAFRVGVGSGEIHNITISNIVIHRAGIAFTIATHFGQSCHGLIEDMIIRDIMAENVSVPFELFAKKDCYIKNIAFQNYHAKCFKGICLHAFDDAIIRDISAKDIHIRITEPPFPYKLLNEDGTNYLLYTENVENVRIENMTAEVPEIFSGMFKDEHKNFDGIVSNRKHRENSHKITKTP